MTLDWDRWNAMRESLDYCWLRMSELADEGLDARAEYETLVEHALQTADRLLAFAGAPQLTSALVWSKWQAGRGEVMTLRERIAQAGIAQSEAYEAALEASRSDD